VHEDAFSYEAKGGNMTKGQQAFPGKEHYGMTLRDWFAGQALAVFCAARNYSCDDMAYACYKVADALLEKRQKDNE
jgi:hypothetical protein